MNKEINLIIDFDSTIIQLETIEVLAEFALKNNPKKDLICNEIKSITDKAMNGKLSFSKALSNRIALLDANKEAVEKTTSFLKDKLSPSFKNNISYFSNNINCFIISGGFKEIILPIVKDFNFIDNNIFANTFIYNNLDKIISVDSENPLSKDNGKNLVANNIKGYNIIIGDGYTDYEVKKYNNANIFIQFTENINRKALNKNADLISSDFSEIIEFINNV
jgi:D-3-phosphoglycerate dehydrogenase